MIRVLGTSLLALACGLAAAVDYPEPVDGIRRSDLFIFAAGDRIEDSGQLLVTGGSFDRTEDFEVVRAAEGGRVMSSIITGANDRYRVQARFEYDANEHALAATGIGNYGAKAATVDIDAKDGGAVLVVAGAVDTVHAAPCGIDCLIDLSPSALSMFTMTRRYDEAQGGLQTFRWIARSLIVDQVLVDASAEIRKLGDFVFRQDGRETLVRQYAFVETMKDEASGKSFKGAFNLYTTADQRPLAFATGGKTVGERVGYAGITQALPPQIPPID